MNRFGWLAAIIAVAMLFTGKEAKPNPVQPPLPSVDVVPKTDPPKVTPKPDINTELLDRLNLILKKLDVASLETLANKLEAIDFKKLQTMIALLDRYGQSVTTAHDAPGSELDIKLSRFEKKLDELAAKHFAEKTVVLEPAPKAVDPLTNQGATTVCTCNGNDKNGCLCLKAGVKCHCTQGVGSVWQKTTQKASTAATKAQSPMKQSASISNTGAIPVRYDGPWMYWNVGGVEWHNGGTGIRDGQVYGGRFTFRDGMMFDTSNVSLPRVSNLTAPASRGGHYEKRCNGVQCWMEWVPN